MDGQCLFVLQVALPLFEPHQTQLQNFKIKSLFYEYHSNRDPLLTDFLLIRFHKSLIVDSNFYVKVLGLV